MLIWLPTPTKRRKHMLVTLRMDGGAHSQRCQCLPGLKWTNTSLNPGRTLATRITTPYQQHSGKPKRFLKMNIFVTLLLPVISNVFTLRQSAVTATEKNDPPHQLKLAMCIHLGDVLDSSCTCVAGKVGFCNHISALMLKICKFSLYKSKTTKDLRKEEDENPQLACTSQLQQ